MVCELLIYCLKCKTRQLDILQMWHFIWEDRCLLLPRICTKTKITTQNSVQLHICSWSLKIIKDTSKLSSRHTIPSLKDRNKFKSYHQVHLVSDKLYWHSLSLDTHKQIAIKRWIYKIGKNDMEERSKEERI